MSTGSTSPDIPERVLLGVRVVESHEPEDERISDPKATAASPTDELSPRGSQDAGKAKLDASFFRTVFSNELGTEPIADQTEQF